MDEYGESADALSAESQSAANSKAIRSAEEKFKRLAWSRVILVRSFMLEQDRVHQVTEDLVMFNDAYRQEEEEQIYQPTLYFDPQAFNREHKPLLTE